MCVYMCVFELCFSMVGFLWLSIVAPVETTEGVEQVDEFPVDLKSVYSHSVELVADVVSGPPLIEHRFTHTLIHTHAHTLTC